jgi:hypothetical protein
MKNIARHTGPPLAGSRILNGPAAIAVPSEGPYQPGTIVNADESGAWNALHGRFEMKGINVAVIAELRSYGDSAFNSARRK